MRRTTKPEIEKLYAFTRKHYVEHYDLQTELVDHLANGMEARWEENSHLGFDENLNLEFKKFGIFGFSDVVEKRRAAMEKKYLQLIWSESLSTLRDPKTLFFTLLLIGFCMLVLRLENGYSILSAGMVLLAAAELIYFSKKHFSHRKKAKNQEKVYLLEKLISDTGGMFSLFLLPLYLMNLLNGIETLEKGIYFSLLCAILVSLMVLLAYIGFYILQKKKEAILEKVYPERKMLSSK